MIKREQQFWSKPLVDFMKALKSDYTNGLSEKEAKKRKKIYGSNIIVQQKKAIVFLQFLSHFKNPLVILLLVASVLSFFVHDKNSAVIILAIVFFSVGLDFFQEYHAQKAVEGLRQTVALKTVVLREGKEKEILSLEIVPGDIVILSAGDLVPADGRLFFAKGLFVNQSLLTGESFPVEKTVDDLNKSKDGLMDAINSVFMGTSILSGEGKMVVCQIGQDTLLGEIAHTLQYLAPSSDFEQGTRKFGYLLMRLTVFLSIFAIMINLFLHRSVFETILFSLGLAVGMTPELLPMITSVTLSKGSLRMGKKKVIIKHLSAIHDLGSMDVLCTDKTGTLTEACIQLAYHLNCEGQESEQVLLLSYLNSYFESGIKSQLDKAVLLYDHVNIEGWKKIDEIPFDFERRKVSVLVENDKKRILIVKGAPEDILLSCSQYEVKGKIKSLNRSEREKLHMLFEQQGKLGFRVLGVAWSSKDNQYNDITLEDDRDLIFAGFATFFDPPKASAREALMMLSKNNVALKIVSGDSEFVTVHLCEELNIPVLGILRGIDISHMSDEALIGAVEKVNLFCRVTPSQKTRIIEALKKRGHVVGFMGDGINDAPSLHVAHIGISVDTAVDIAKEAADVILLEHNLNVVNDGVIEGRRTYGNIMKYIMMVTSSNFGNMLSMVGALFMVPFLPMTAPQILLNNLLYDISEVAIPLDHVDEESLAKPQKWSMRFIVKFMCFFGPISSMFDFCMFFMMFKIFHVTESLFQTVWFVESLATQVLVIFIIRTRFSIFKSRPHPLLIFLSIFILLLGVIITLTPWGGYFGFVKPPMIFFFILMVMVVVYLTIAEIGKRIFYRVFV